MKAVTCRAGLAALAIATIAGCAPRVTDIPDGSDPGFSGTPGTIGTPGATGPAAGAGGLYGGTLPGTSISDRVLFTVDQTTLNDSARAILDAQIGWLQQNPAQAILIEGHADERGTSEYNMGLGSARASAVRNYMVSRGIPDSRVRIITYGRERPIATCAEEACWAQNRRAVTVVTGTVGS